MPLSRITSGAIANGAVQVADVADGSITGPKLGQTAINANNVVDGAITGNKLGATSINANNIVDGAIVSSKLSSTISVSGNFLANNITANTNIITAAGSNAAPAIYPTGDTDTGFYFPSTNNVSFAEGGTGYNVGYRNVPAVGTKIGSYTLQTSDVGKYVQVGSGGSITIPNNVFLEGDVISIFNNTTGSINITCSITTAYIAGTDTDKATMNLASRGVATVLFSNSTTCVVSGNLT